MPLTAKRRSTGEVICILDYEAPRRDVPADDLVCPFCGERMILRAGPLRAAHFAHRRRCAYEGWYEPESAEHRAFKEAVWRYLKADAFWEEGQVEMEVPIPEARRVADLLVTFPNGWRVAHECQVSRIGLEELKARSGAYLDAGIDVLWWFTHERLREARKWLPGWLLRFQGVVLEGYIRLEVGEEEEL